MKLFTASTVLILSVVVSGKGRATAKECGEGEKLLKMEMDYTGDAWENVWQLTDICTGEVLDGNCPGTEGKPRKYRKEWCLSEKTTYSIDARAQNGQLCRNGRKPSRGNMTWDVNWNDFEFDLYQYSFYQTFTFSKDGLKHRCSGEPVPDTKCSNECPAEIPVQRTSTQGSSSGDPHFKTWTGDKYDYHGECDLVLLDHPSFMDGLGLRVHIRTTRVKYFSYIEKVAVQIGSDVLEFDNDAENFLINGMKAEENRQHHKTMFAGFIVRRDNKAISIRLSDQLAGGAKIDFHTRKNGFPAVIVDAAHTDIFKGSLGLLGDWHTGQTLARDGVTEITVDPENASAFALEWQVRDTEPMLFSEYRSPQYPNVCIPAKKMKMKGLGKSLVSQEAEEACAHWKHDKEDCIFDVIATQDVLVAEEGHIVHIE